MPGLTEASPLPTRPCSNMRLPVASCGGRDAFPPTSWNARTSLFLRPKLWAGLNYLRSVDFGTYHFELEAIWTAHELRSHLRRLLIDFLGQQTQPTDREALLMERAFDWPDQRWPAYRAMSGSPGWFERFAPTFIAESMSENDEAADQTIQVLSRAWSFAEDEVTRLLLDRWAPQPQHDLRSWMVLANAPRWTDEALGFACTIVRRAEMAQFSIDRAVATIGVKQPAAALHLVRARLDHQLAVAQATALESVIEQEQDWETLPTLAERAPQIFLDILWALGSRGTSKRSNPSLPSAPGDLATPLAWMQTSGLSKKNQE